MKFLFKKIESFMRGLYYSLRWLVFFLIRVHSFSHIKQIQTTKKLQILANGPSLKNDIVGLGSSDADKMVVNYFYLSEYFSKLAPRYYVIADPLFFNSDLGVCLLKSLEEIVHWDMTLFIPIEQNNSIIKINNKNVRVVQYISNEYKGFTNIAHFLFKHNLAMPGAQNVTIPCIFLGINLGYKKIELYGVDHSWTETIRVNEKNEVCLVDNHFYDKEKSVLKPWISISGEVYKMDAILKTLSVVFESHRILRKYADYRGCKVTNKTKCSYIDAYDR